MRIALISDIHGNLPALDAVLAEIARVGADLTVNLGDVLSGPLWPAETARRLMPLGLPTIAGNHERQLLTQPRERMSASDAVTVRQLRSAELDWLAALPPTRWLAGDLFCCHGTPASDLDYLLETVTPDFGQDGSRGVRAAGTDEIAARLDGVPAALVVCGHTHLPRIVQVGRTLVVNPGSVGLPAYDDTHPHPHHVESGSPHARWALVERTAGGWRASLHATDYDWPAASARAERAGRGDWADALCSGFVGRTQSG